MPPSTSKKHRQDRPDFTVALRAAAWSYERNGTPFTPKTLQAAVQQARQGMSGDVSPQGLRVDFTASSYQPLGMQAQQTTLKGLDLESFAAAAAQRLGAAVQVGEPSPLQIREAVLELV